MLVNVSYKIKDEKTRAREISGLVEAMEYLNIFEATLITKEEESVAEAAGKKIFIVPLYRCGFYRYIPKPLHCIATPFE